MTGDHEWDHKAPLVPEMSPVFIKVDEVRRMLAAAIVAAGSQKAFAERHGMSGAYVSEVVRGTRNPGPAVLDAIGMERVVGYRRRTS